MQLPITPYEARQRHLQGDDIFEVGGYTFISEDGAPWVMKGEFIVASTSGDFGDAITPSTVWVEEN